MFSIHKKSVDAKVVGSTLVAAFCNSDPPLIWKFDLERNHSFTLALQGEGAELELGVTSPKGEFYSVARFAHREDAEQAFAAVQKALMKRKCGWIRTLLAWIGAAALLVMFFLFLKNLIFGVHFMHLTSTVTKPAILEGVPLPADQVLRPPP